MNLEEFKKVIRDHHQTFLKSIIEAIINSYFAMYDDFDNLRYYLEEIDEAKYNVIYDVFNGLDVWWEYDVDSLKDFVKEFAPPRLRNYFLWEELKRYPDLYDQSSKHKEICLDNLIEPPKKETFANEENPFDPNSYISNYDGLNDYNLSSIVENMANIPPVEQTSSTELEAINNILNDIKDPIIEPPEKEEYIGEDNPFDPNFFITESASLENDFNFASLLKSLETATNYEKELLKKQLIFLNEFLNENPYESDIDKIKTEIKEEWVLTIMNKQIEWYLSYYGVNDDEDMKKELDEIFAFKNALDNDIDYAYSEFYDVWQSLAKSPQIDQLKLHDTIKILDNTKNNLETEITKLLETGNELYFISAIIYMKNLKNKAFCILVFNMIFNEELDFKTYSSEAKEKLVDADEIEKALNEGLSLNDIPNIIEVLSKLSCFDILELINMYGFDLNTQDNLGNTLIMKVLIPCSDNILREFVFLPGNDKILSLLKLDFNLALTNKEGLNTYDIIMKYHADNSELVETISRIYGVFYDKTSKEFQKELTLARKKITENKM